MANVIDDTRQRLEARSKELRPLIDEYTQIQSVLNSLRKPDAPKAERQTRNTAKRKRTRASASEIEARKSDALALIQKTPGTRQADLAKALDVSYPIAVDTVKRLLADKSIKQQSGERTGFEVA